MPQVFVMLGVVVVAVVCLSAVVVASWAAWRRTSAVESVAPSIPLAVAQAAGPRAARTTLADEAVATPEPELFDRVVRVMTLIFLASVGVVVFVGGEYPDTNVGIQLVLAGGMLSIVVLQDLLPASVLGRARYWLEALSAVFFIALLTGLTGGLMSPFVIGFFLIVGGASLSLNDLAPVLLALLASGAYALVGVAVAPADQLTVAAFVHLMFTVICLSLLAYLASVVGREQRRAREAAISLSRFDPLTGLYNRAYFFSVLDREIRRAARNSGHLAVLMLDLDDLKPVNDTFGHQRGDELLRAVTDAIQRNVRSTDVAARYGGDEFVVLLSDTEPEGAHVVAEKLRSDIAALAVGPMERPARTSASFGVVAYPDDGTTMDALMTDVDKAMYESKRRGKNQIVGYMTRIERVATPLTEERTTMMQRRPGAAVSQAPGTGQRSGRVPPVRPRPENPAAAPRAVRELRPPTARQPVSPAADASPGAPPAARPALSPATRVPVAPAARVPAIPGARVPAAPAADLPAWDSTQQAPGSAGTRPRSAEDPYVSFHIEPENAEDQPSKPNAEPRDFTGR